jgi:hypothetical protein
MKVSSAMTYWMELIIVAGVFWATVAIQAGIHVRFKLPEVRDDEAKRLTRVAGAIAVGIQITNALLAAILTVMLIR